MILVKNAISANLSTSLPKNNSVTANCHWNVKAPHSQLELFGTGHNELTRTEIDLERAEKINKIKAAAKNTPEINGRPDLTCFIARKDLPAVMPATKKTRIVGAGLSR